MSDQLTLETSFHNARYNLSKNLSLLSTVLLLTIGTVYFFENDISAWFIIIGGAISLGVYITTIRTKKYIWPAAICLTLLTILNVFNLSVASNFNHIGDYFWSICIVTTGFFVLGKKWGIALLIANLLIIFTVFYLVRSEYLIQIEKPFTAFSQINFFINLCVGGTLFSYLILEFLKQNREIAQKYIKANEELKVLNEEKTVMLREIHHRVKNNLQIVTSLLRLQSGELEDEKITHEFSEAIDRISAIAKIHDKMYNNKALNRIDLSEYLHDLIKDLLDSYTKKQRINTKITTNIDSLPPNYLVPLALIFNELVTNSIKHAFVDQSERNIIIDAIVDENHLVNLLYTDNGAWKEPAPNSKSIGLELIDSFVDQLDGTCTIDKSNGTTYTIIFTING